jgi:AraC family transcriptional regulator
MQNSTTSRAQSKPVGIQIAILPTPLFSFARFSQAEENPGSPIVRVPQAEAFAAIVQLQGFELHNLWRDGRLLHKGGHACHSMGIADLTHAYSCQHISAFDNVRLQLDRVQLDRLSDELTGVRLGGLKLVQHAIDPIMLGLMQALLPSLRRGAPKNALFIEHVMMAAGAHLMRRYGRQEDPLRRSAAGSRMMAQQQALAQEYMLAHLAQDFTLEDVARHCGMSRARFARAFKKTMGDTPFGWVRGQKIERAKRLLRGEDLTLAQISAECGFADQSHFTRVFTHLVGTSPRLWRLAALN